MDTRLDVWNNWKIENLIGQGAFGKVYKVKKTDVEYDCYKAVKIISFPQDEFELIELKNSGMDAEAIEEYYNEIMRTITNEIRIMLALRESQHVVFIEDYKLERTENGIGGCVYIRMELLESLSKYIEKKKTLSILEIIHLGIDICSALEYCENLNVVHRDIKTDNIFVDEDGSFKLGDFGIAKRMALNSFMHTQKGTEMYIAPEVYQGAHYNHTVDMYSLGILLYRLINKGRFPFMPKMPTSLKPNDAKIAVQRRLRGERLETLQEIKGTKLEYVILHACEYESYNRYQNAREMKADLEDCLRLMNKPGTVQGSKLKFSKGW